MYICHDASIIILQTIELHIIRKLKIFKDVDTYLYIFILMNLAFSPWYTTIDPGFMISTNLNNLYQDICIVMSQIETD